MSSSSGDWKQLASPANTREVPRAFMASIKNCRLIPISHKAGELSAKHAASTLARSLDILHVAAALTLGARVFVSFDDRQRQLARRARRKVLPRIRP